MTDLLEWRGGIHADRVVLQDFTCTEQATKNPRKRWRLEHPRVWEWRVQCCIRALRPPYGIPRHMLVGLDSDGIAAVSYFEELDGPGNVSLMYMAVAERLRFKGGGFADEMASVTVDSILARGFEVGVASITLSAHVWEENEASQKMCRRLGLIHTGMFSPGAQVWGQEIILAPDE